MLDKNLSKSKVRKVFEAFVKKVILNRISPNQLTLFGVICGLISAFLIFLSSYAIELNFLVIILTFAVIFMIISFFFDVIDGITARMSETSKFGGILDIFCDRTVEVAILVALIMTNQELLSLPGLFSLGAMVLCISMFLMVGGIVEETELDDIQKVIYYRRGLMERSETFIFLVLMTLLIFLRFILLWLFGILVLLTAILRLRDAYHLFEKPDVIEDVNEPEL